MSADAAVRYLVAIIGGSALGALIGWIVQAITGAEGWWLVGLLAGLIAGAVLGFVSLDAYDGRRKMEDGEQTADDDRGLAIEGRGSRIGLEDTPSSVPRSGPPSSAVERGEREQ